MVEPYTEGIRDLASSCLRIQSFQLKSIAALRQLEVGLFLVLKGLQSIIIAFQACIDILSTSIGRRNTGKFKADRVVFNTEGLDWQVQKSGAGTEVEA